MDSPWSTRLQRFLYDNVLPLINKAFKSVDDGIADSLKFVMVSDAVFDIWKRSFTHYSYEPNLDRNSRHLAFQGSRLVEFYASQQLESRLTIDSYLRSVFVSAEWKMRHCRRISKSLRLSQYMRSLFQITDQIEEDLLDALVGAVSAIEERIRETEPDNRLQNLAMALCDRLYGDWFDQIKNNSRDVSTISAREELISLHEHLGWTDTATFDLWELGRPKPIKKRGEIVSYEVKFEMTPRRSFG